MDRDIDEMEDLQRLAHLKLSGHRRDDPQSEPTHMGHKEEQTETRKFICNKCDKDHKSSDDLEEHLDSHYEDGDFACDTCLFQTNRLRLLREHLLKTQGHTSGQVRGKTAIKCKFCETKFIDRKELAEHKSKEHKTYQTCKYFKESKCTMTRCRYYHKILKEGDCICFQCGDEFNNISAMMMHRKSKHGTKECTGCDRTDVDCWFMHATRVETSPNRNKQKNTPRNITPNKHTAPQGFWKVPQNVAPSIPALDVEAIMKTIENRVQKTMESFMKQMQIKNQ